MESSLHRKILESLYKSYENLALKERHLGIAQLSESEMSSLTEGDLFDLIAELKDLVRSPVPR